MERGLRPDSNLDETRPFEEYIVKNGWEKLTNIPKLVVVSWFMSSTYANTFCEREDDQVMVRDKMVSFSLDDINEFYDLEFQEYLHERTRL